MSAQPIDQLRTSFRGELIQPTDARYEESRKVYNAMISRKPRLIAKCVDAADVITAVNFGRQQDLKVSIRGGGHNAGGLGICDDGLVIDLSQIKYVHVDPEAQTVRVGGGCTWADVDHATHAASQGGTNTLRIEFLPFDRRGLDGFFRQRGEGGFFFQLISKGLHLSQQHALLVTRSRQIRNQALRVPREPRPVLIHI